MKSIFICLLNFQSLSKIETDLPKSGSKKLENFTLFFAVKKSSSTTSNTASHLLQHWRTWTCLCLGINWTRHQHQPQTHPHLPLSWQQSHLLMHILMQCWTWLPVCHQRQLNWLMPVRESFQLSRSHLCLNSGQSPEPPKEEVSNHNQCFCIVCYYFWHCCVHVSC